MKRNFSKKIFSVLLALILVLTPLISCFARSRIIEGEQDCPFIYVHGFMAKDIYQDKYDLENDDVVWPPSGSDILNVVKDNLGGILSFLVTRDYDALSELLVEPCNELLGKGNLDDGEVTDKSGIRFEYPDKETITKTSQLSFNYDWRIDPVEVADQLNDYIEYVCEASGCDQVTLECHSFGGVVTVSYITIYEQARIDNGQKPRLKSVCYNSTAIFGESYTGEMLSGNMDLNDESLTEFIKEALGETEYSNLLNGLFDILKASGVTGDICQLGNDIIKYCGPVVIKEVIAPMFAGWLSIWAMIPDEYLEDCMDYVFNEIYADDSEDAHDGLKAKIENYNSKVRWTKKQVLEKQINEWDTNVYNVCRYGYCSVPTSASWKNMSDTVIDLKYASWGATTTDYNKKLSQDYVASRDAKYINPDCNIDASTCMVPDQTWFFRGMKHAVNSDPMDDMVLELLCYDGQANINTFEQYPQYIQYDSENDIISADTEGTPKENLTFLDKIFNAYLRILSKLSNLIDRIFRIFK